MLGAEQRWPSLPMRLEKQFRLGALDGIWPQIVSINPLSG